MTLFPTALLPLASLPLAIAQAAPVLSEAPGPIAGPVEARAEECLMLAASDPVTAISTASQWLGEGATAGVTHAQECLGHSYVRLLRWDAAEDAFLAARDAAVPGNHDRRARLSAMAGNAALADMRNVDALADLRAAQAEAGQVSDPQLSASIESDLARALVALKRPGEAASALERARGLDPQNSEVWLLSATLARRQGDLAAASRLINNATSLSPQDPAVGLEAGVIAVLGGDEAAARRSWGAVMQIAPGSNEAQTAQSYIAQLDDTAAGETAP